MRKLRFITTALKRPLWAVVTTLWTAFSAGSDFRDALISKAWQKRLFIDTWPDLTWQTWVIGALAIVVLALVNHFSKVTAALQAEHDKFAFRVDPESVSNELRFDRQGGLPVLNFQFLALFENADAVANVVTRACVQVVQRKALGQLVVIASSVLYAFEQPLGPPSTNFSKGLAVAPKTISPFYRFIGGAVLPERIQSFRSDIHSEIRISVMGRTDTVWRMPMPVVVERVEPVIPAGLMP